ncbi:hypothetical protein GYMLUDRAFT_243198 [Collybiopsis luxurians FD-317 M1]|uniref:Uncharacterized protein n=1 Tax=Collybiopsis luxurians FD-317 M1 TaxID=944289 RepID=A0A0D0C1V6_9AGAR|nr:hypothetical protein GYMLUDRAFT_243198 [Collybiopsis luxurians FD-317 M1]
MPILERAVISALLSSRSNSTQINSVLRSPGSVDGSCNWNKSISGWTHFDTDFVTAAVQQAHRAAASASSSRYQVSNLSATQTSEDARKPTARVEVSVYAGQIKALSKRWKEPKGREEQKIKDMEELINHRLKKQWSKSR